jgi:hypothetical protein
MYCVYFRQPSIFCLITPSYGTAVTGSQHVIIRSAQWESGLKTGLVASDFLASQSNGYASRGLKPLIMIFYYLKVF